MAEEISPRPSSGTPKKIRGRDSLKRETRGGKRTGVTYEKIFDSTTMYAPLLIFGSIMAA